MQSCTPQATGKTDKVVEVHTKDEVDNKLESELLSKKKASKE